MKKALFTFLLLFAATAMNAQTIVKGDMNDDKELTITDAVSVVDVISVHIKARSCSSIPKTSLSRRLY